MRKFLKDHVWALIIWVAISLIAVFTLPNINQLTREHSTIDVPATAESSKANEIANHWGHGQNNTYQIGIIFHKEHGKLNAEDRENIKETIRFLRDNKQKYGFKKMMAPYDNMATKKKLISKDKTTAVAQLYVFKKHGSVSSINTQLTKAAKTKGLKTYVSGADILTDDFSGAVQEGIKKTEVISIIFIFIVLIIVFRSPIVPLISLLTVGISFITSFSLVTNLVEKFNFPFSNFTQVFMVIVLFGIGTDYNILLYDKFKENLGKGMENREAMHDALKSAGKTIMYSGSSLLIGFTSLGLAKFSVYQSAVGVAVGVAVLLVVILTLNPFFMLVLGRKMFWPVKEFKGESTSPLWHGISKQTLLHPIISLVVVALVAAPFFMTYSNKLNYDDTDEISNSTPSKKGFLVVEKHFSKGLAEPSYLYIKSDHKLDNQKDLKAIDDLTRKIQASEGVDFATSVTQPYGEKIKQLYVKNQLKTVNKGVNTARKGLDTLSSGSDQMTNGLGQLASGSQTLYDGLNLMSNQLNSQLSGANASQLAQLQSGLPQINSGIQQLNSALQQSGASVNTSALQGHLTNVGQQARVIGNNLTAAGSTLQSLSGSSTSSMNTEQILQQYRAVETKANLTAAQKIAMEAALQQILTGVQGQVKQQQTATTQKLQSVAGNLQAAGNADKSLARSMQSVAGTAKNLQSMLSQVAVLKAQVNRLATASGVALPGATTALNQLTSGLQQVQTAVNSSLPGVSQLTAGANRLFQSSPQISNGITKVSDGLGTGQTYLNGLQNSASADSFYIPKSALSTNLFKESMDNYLSADKKSAQIIIVMKSNPSADKTTGQVHQLSKMARQSIKGTSLAGSDVQMSGQTSKIYDMKTVSSQDFLRTAVIMIVGIGIALIFVTRSILQPIFILGTLVIAYMMSLAINHGITGMTLHRSMLTWNTPFFSFIMLIALGVDYSIFLMMRYREYRAEMIPSKAMLKACSVIGTVVISAAIILGGTFAALIPSGVPTLIEVAISVVIGLLILVFLIPINLPAAIKLTYEGFGKPFPDRKKHD
ncbi:MAG: MMPL family transporter [Lactobacillus sp.]|jgi:RND superfamily putative drug exporter|nr:MMPL family transporter [Lactobacillus sp.]MCI1974032.1 MMPL family transporter [Lactobacillus sp.]